MGTSSRADRTAGQVLYRAGVLAAGAVLVVTVLSAIFLPLGLWRPAVVLPVVAVGLASVWRLGRGIPAPPVPAWTAWTTVAGAASFGVWSALTHAEHVVLRRDAGSYALYAQWIASHHGLPVADHLDAFGGPSALGEPTFSLASPAYYQVAHGAGADVVPQFLPGAPAVYSLGHWLAGWSGLLMAPALVGAFAVLAMAGLTARLLGPRVAPLAAAGLALTQPVLHAARSTYSEPVALLVLLAVAALAVDATRSSGRRAAWIGVATGAGLGLVSLIRVDALLEVVLLLPVLLMMAIRRHRAALPAGTAAVVTSVLGIGWAVLFSRPYLRENASSLEGLAAGGVALVGGCLALLGASRAVRRLLRGRSGSLPTARLLRAPWLPAGASVATVLLGLLLASRPLWLVTRQPGTPAAGMIGALQWDQHLAVDGTRTYAEDSVIWVTWWTGPVAVVLCLCTVALLAAGVVRWLQAGPRATVPAWLVPVTVAVASTLLTLFRPGITPDHPWADRRLVPVVLPTVVLAATAGVQASLTWLRGRVSVPRLRWVAVLGVVLLLVPAADATAPVALERTEAGELGAVHALCATLGPQDAVLAVDGRAGNEWPQVVRGVCGVPAAVVHLDQISDPIEARAVMTRIAGRVLAAGHRPVLLTADSPDPLVRLGLQPVHVAAVRSQEDPRLLTTPPRGSTLLTVDVWSAAWPEQGTAGS